MHITDDGSIELRKAVAATTVEGRPGIRDEALSSDGRFLYALHADTGRVFGWDVAAGRDAHRNRVGKRPATDGCGAGRGAADPKPGELYCAPRRGVEQSGSSPGS
jgi:hypothetical protein